MPAPQAVPPWELEKQRAAARPSVRWFALAASVFLAVVIGAGVWWNTQDRTKLIAEVVKHANKERDVMIASEKRVKEEKLQRTFAAGGAKLLRDLPISIARTCKVRGYPAPHVVIQTSSGAVAVLLMQNQRFFVSHDFAAQGFEGRIVPMENGNSIAVLGDSKDAVKQGAEMMKGALDWPEQPLVITLPAPRDSVRHPADKSPDK